MNEKSITALFTIINFLDTAPKSARAVCKVLEELGFKEVELWKSSQRGSAKHYIWGDFGNSITGYFVEQTILDYDLRINETTFRDLLEDFYNKAEASDLDKDWNGNATPQWIASLKILKTILSTNRPR